MDGHGRLQAPRSLGTTRYRRLSRVRIKLERGRNYQTWNIVIPLLSISVAILFALLVMLTPMLISLEMA